MSTSVCGRRGSPPCGCCCWRATLSAPLPLQPLPRPRPPATARRGRDGHRWCSRWGLAFVCSLNRLSSVFEFALIYLYWLTGHKTPSYLLTLALKVLGKWPVIFKAVKNVVYITYLKSLKVLEFWFVSCQTERFWILTSSCQTESFWILNSSCQTESFWILTSSCLNQMFLNSDYFLSGRKAIDILTDFENNYLASNFGWLLLCVNQNHQMTILWHLNCEVKGVHESHWVG